MAEMVEIAAFAGCQPCRFETSRRTQKDCHQSWEQAWKERNQILIAAQRIDSMEVSMTIETALAVVNLY